jgi:outer membrane protein, multidrug efflux system
VETEGLHSPVDSLRYQKALLDLIRQLESIQSVLAISKTELAQLINLPPGQPYTLAVPGDMRINSVRIPIAQMEDAALLLNPDIRELSYQKRISVDETHKALLRLLPGITFSYDPSYDSNSFLVNHYWATGAVRIGGYLNGLLTFPSTYRRATNNEKLADLKREAMSMAVLAKLHIAYQQYLAASREFRRSQQVSDVDSRLYDQIRNRTATDVGGDLERISAQVSAVTSQLRSYQSYAEAQAALGRLYATLGIDPTPDHADMLDLSSLGAAVRHGMDQHLAPVVPGTDPVLNAKAQATTAEATTAEATTTSVAAVAQAAAPTQQQ